MTALCVNDMIARLKVFVAGYPMVPKQLERQSEEETQTDRESEVLKQTAVEA